MWLNRCFTQNWVLMYYAYKMLVPCMLCSKLDKRYKSHNSSPDAYLPFLWLCRLLQVLFLHHKVIEMVYVHKKTGFPNSLTERKQMYRNRKPLQVGNNNRILFGKPERGTQILFWIKCESWKAPLWVRFSLCWCWIMITRSKKQP